MVNLVVFWVDYSRIDFFDSCSHCSVRLPFSFWFEVSAEVSSKISTHCCLRDLKPAKENFANDDNLEFSQIINGLMMLSYAK